VDTSPSDLMLEKARAVRASGIATPLELVEQLGRALDSLEQQLDRLRERLEPVLVEPEPRPSLAGEPSPGRTLLSQRLTHLAAYAERLGEAANELHARVEL
jgi:hypothetical protein